MRAVFRLCLPLFAAVGAGCACVSPAGQECPAYRVAAVSPPAAAPEAVVFVLDGIGNFQTTSSGLRRAVEEGGLPLHVQTVEWSHGYGRIFADHLDQAHARREGQKLAQEILCYERSEEHTSELQSRQYLVCRLLLEKN